MRFDSHAVITFYTDVAKHAGKYPIPLVGYAVMRFPKPLLHRYAMMEYSTVLEKVINLYPMYHHQDKLLLMLIINKRESML